MKEGLFMIMGNLRFQREYLAIYKNNTESTTHVMRTGLNSLKMLKLLK